MDIELKNISVRELVKEYQDNQEAGVVGSSGFAYSHSPAASSNPSLYASLASRAIKNRSWRW